MTAAGRHSPARGAAGHHDAAVARPASHRHGPSPRLAAPTTAARRSAVQVPNEPPTSSAALPSLYPAQHAHPRGIGDAGAPDGAMILNGHGYPDGRRGADVEGHGGPAWPWPPPTYAPYASPPHAPLPPHYHLQQQQQQQQQPWSSSPPHHPQPPYQPPYQLYQQPSQQQPPPLGAPAAEGGGSPTAFDGGHCHVCVRIRPTTTEDVTRGLTRRNVPAAVSAPQRGMPRGERVFDRVAFDSRRQTVTLHPPDDARTGQPIHTSQELQFDQVIGPDASQRDTFHQSGIEHLIRHCLDGYAATAFVYGQTGSGKTYTISGPQDAHAASQGPQTWGLVQHSLDALFQAIEQERQRPGIPVSRVVQASYLEIYNEQIIDLLNPSSGPLPIRWSSSAGFYVENQIKMDCDALEDCHHVLNEGLRNRSVRAHALNDYSSRSHALLTLYVNVVEAVPQAGDSLRKHGKLCFVDLAGSERLAETKNAGDARTESVNINQSLTTLGRCIAMLSDPKRKADHVPFRDSKLTQLLADALGGKAYMLMIACITLLPAQVPESINTLRYAQRAKAIASRPVVQVNPGEERLLALKQALNAAQEENRILRSAMGGDEARRVLAQARGSGAAAAAYGAPPEMDDELHALRDANQQLLALKYHAELAYRDLQTENWALRHELHPYRLATGGPPLLPVGGGFDTPSDGDGVSAYERRLATAGPPLDGMPVAAFPAYPQAYPPSYQQPQPQQPPPPPPAPEMPGQRRRSSYVAITQQRKMQQQQQVRARRPAATTAAAGSGSGAASGRPSGVGPAGSVGASRPASQHTAAGAAFNHVPRSLHPLGAARSQAVEDSSPDLPSGFDAQQGQLGAYPSGEDLSF